MESKNNTGALFINNNRKSETHPNMKGSVIVDGTEYWISAWKKVTEKQEVMFSLSLQPKQQQPPQQAANDIMDFLNELE